MNTDERIDELEIKITLMEQTIEQLNQVIITQDTELLGLKHHLSQMKKQLNNVSDRIAPLTEETPPPHY